MEHNEFFIAWLHNAHAMENKLIQVLEEHIDQATDFPEVSSVLEQHLEETKKHAGTVERILRDLGEDTSKVKDTMGNIMGMVTGSSTATAEDRVVKNSIADFAAEHMEIASYKALIAAAEELGHPEIASDLEDILEDEEEMAEWLDDNLPELVRMFLGEDIEEEDGETDDEE
jgi:ferritin-like metal-binding protein YciE